MNNVFRNPDTREWLVMVGSALVGLFIMLALPSWEYTTYDWRLRLTASAPMHSSIAMIGLERNRGYGCSTNSWHPAKLAGQLERLHQAGATAIGVAVPLEGVARPACGGLESEHELLQVGKYLKATGTIVVYPDTIQSSRQAPGDAIGRLAISPDADGVIRRPGLTEPLQPLGWKLATLIRPSLIDTRLKKTGEENEHALIHFAGRWTENGLPYQTTGLVDTWSLRQLEQFVGGKSVMLVNADPHLNSVRTPLDDAVPLGYVHAHLLNTALTQSWLQETSTPFGIVLVVFLALVGTRFMSVWGWQGITGLLCMYGLMTWLGFSFMGISFPLAAPLFVLLGAGGGIALCSYWDLSHRTARQLIRAERILAQQEATSEHLAEAVRREQDKLQESVGKIEELTDRVESLRLEKEESQAMEEVARQHVEQLKHQQELLRRKAFAVTQGAPPLTREDDHQLQEECRALGIITQDPGMLELFRDVKTIAPLPGHVLLLGETGTGKELFANAIHQLSPRSSSPFLKLNMAAISGELFESELFGHRKGAFSGAVRDQEGAFKAADGGTLFLDEIGELPWVQQGKLLRVLQHGTFMPVGSHREVTANVRIIAATNKNLDQEVEAGRFRQDLYWRLKQYVFRLPPLRDRGATDRKLLAEHLIQRICRDNHQTSVPLNQEALDWINRQPWNGNLRELEYVLRQALIATNGSLITRQHVENAVHSSSPSPAVPTIINQEQSKGDSTVVSISRLDDQAVLSELQHQGFDLVATARALGGCDRGTVRERLRGIGFQALVNHDADVEAAARHLAAGNPATVTKVKKKIQESYEGLLEVCRLHSSLDEALAAYRKRNRNLPERYLLSIEALIRRYFQ